MTAALNRRLGALDAASVLAPFPWATASVNLLGCLLFGVVAALLPEEESGSPVRVFLLAGFLGAFTTFSTFAFDSVRLLQESRPGSALLNLALQNAGGLLFLGLGLWLGGWCSRCFGGEG
jgi:CrcB protein